VLDIKKIVFPVTHAMTRALLSPSHNVLDVARDGIVLVDSAGRIVELNAVARRFLNRVDGDYSGLDFWSAVPPGIAELHQIGAAKAMALHKDHVFTERSDFECDWLEYGFRPHSTGYVVNLRDVTHKHELQLLLTKNKHTNLLLFEKNPNAMWVFDMGSRRILSVNQAACDFYAMTRSSFLALQLGALFPDHLGTALFDSVDQAGSSELALQICNQVKGDGSLVLVELACGRIVWQDHQAMLVTVSDVAQRHLSDHTLRQENTELKLALSSAHEALKNASRDLTALTHALSHDMQIPLHVVNGFAAILAKKYGELIDHTGRHYINRIQDSTRLMAELVDDLRRLVQLPQRSAPLETLDLTALCAAIVDDLRFRHPDRTVTFEINARSAVAADKSLLVIALSCLLDNAWKFTSKKIDAWVKVAVIAGDRPGELVLQVSDNGEGFDTAYSDKLFVAFQRLHSGAEYPGNGLGLVTVLRVAERHGGRVWAQSTPNGASFYMALPQVPGEHAIQQPN
jgi:signal transduction histidine kinase